MTTPIGSTPSSSVPTDDVTLKTRPHTPGEAAFSSYIWILSALVYALALTLSITSQSLWTDEAFSAWLAAHRTFSALLHSLGTGDSSDLQMSLYYVYLFFWSKLFGTGEYALRAANIPFILIFSYSLVWTSLRIYQSRLAWLAPALLPFVWAYAGEARPYMALLAFSTAALASLLGFISFGVKKFAWLFLTWVLLGTLFHMLMLLVALPALVIAWPTRKWRSWRVPLAAFGIPFLALAVFLAWTLARHQLQYEYAKPGIKQMASVFYELTGFSGLGPNRKLSLDFRSHIVSLALGGSAILAGSAFAIYRELRARANPVLHALSLAACVACVEPVILAVITGQQPDARHLSALVPLFLFLLTGVLAQHTRVAGAAMFLLAAGWLTADVRSAIFPEYGREDYRKAVAAAIAIHQRTGADIVLDADPVAAGYYGLDLRGEAPCFPFVQNCSAALDQVPWARTVPAIDAEVWPRNRILDFLASARSPVVVIDRLNRVRRTSPWHPILAAHPEAEREQVHGFDIVLLEPGS